MLATIGYSTLDALIDATVPSQIRSASSLSLPAQGETEALHDVMDLMSSNKVYRSYIGLGYYDTITPPVILRNVIENPAWYTPYTPYQAEIAQGRLEMLLNYQTMVSDLTALPVSNSSLLDEGTAAAEAMNMSYNAGSKKKKTFIVSQDVHPQTIAVVKTRAKGLDITVKVQNESELDLTSAAAGQTERDTYCSHAVRRCDDFNVSFA
jgi:glycine cleavage system P protein (glycine dehydrogenase)